MDKLGPFVAYKLIFVQKNSPSTSWNTLIYL